MDPINIYMLLMISATIVMTGVVYYSRKNKG